MAIQELYQFLSQEMGLAQQSMVRILDRCPHPTIRQINQFVLQSGSKQLRPILVFLSYQAAGGKKDGLHMDHDAVKAGVAMELMHRASLIHDDVIDHAQYRHNQLSIQAKWSPETAVAFGNFLYSEAFHLISSSVYPEVIQALTLATREMCEGELIQVCERGCFDFSREAYLEMIRLKTASLFSASCRMGAVVAGADARVCTALYDFGLALGMVFQMADDTMDLTAPKEALGKNPGQDIASGELTLPLIHLLAEEKNPQHIKNLILGSKDPAVFAQLRTIFLQSLAFQKTKDDIEFYVKKANASLAILKPSAALALLQGLQIFVLERMTPKK